MSFQRAFPAHWSFVVYWHKVAYNASLLPCEYVWNLMWCSVPYSWYHYFLLFLIITTRSLFILFIFSETSIWVHWFFSVFTFTDFGSCVYYLYFLCFALNLICSFSCLLRLSLDYWLKPSFSSWSVSAAYFSISSILAACHLIIFPNTEQLRVVKKYLYT